MLDEAVFSIFDEDESINWREDVEVCGDVVSIFKEFKDEELEYEDIDAVEVDKEDEVEPDALFNSRGAACIKEILFFPLKDVFSSESLL